MLLNGCIVVKKRPIICCTAWVHGIHPEPEKLSFFTDSLWKFVFDKGLEWYRGYERVEIDEEKGAQKKDGFKEFLDEDSGEIEIEDHDDFAREELSYDGAFNPVAPPGLGRATGRHGSSRWRQAEHFFDDLADYRMEREGLRKEAFVGKIEKWVFEGKMIEKNGSYFRSTPLSWDE